jgi:uncharacterized protein
MDHLVELSEGLIRPLLRPYQRPLVDRLRNAGRLALLTGKRGVGKTTCLVQLCAELNESEGRFPKALYLPADHIRLQDASIHDVAEWFAQTGGELLCVDEVHTAPDWGASLKSIYTSFPSLRVVASTSAAIGIEQTGRNRSSGLAVQGLPVLSFREHLELTTGLTLSPLSLDDLSHHHPAAARRVVEAVEAKGLKILSTFEDYLRVGAYAFHLEHEDRQLFYLAVSQAVRTSIEVDLIAAHPRLSGASVRTMLELLAVLSASVPFTPDLRKLKTLLGIGDERTLKQYLRHLADAGVLNLLMLAERKLAAVEKPDRIYPGDSAQLFASAGERAVRGTVCETFFLQSLLPEHDLVTPGRAGFIVDSGLRVEVTGNSKGTRQKGGEPDAVLAVDGIEVGAGRRVPLWLFGFLR